MARTSRLDEFVANQLAEHSDPEGAVLGSYVIVAELVYPDHIALDVAVSEGTPPWTVDGMLGYALDFVKEPVFWEGEVVPYEGEDGEELD